MSVIKRTYTDREIKDMLRIVERRLIKSKALVSGGSFGYEDIANEAVATVIKRNLPLSCAYQQACWLRIDKIRHLMCSRKKGPKGNWVLTEKPLPVSIYSTRVGTDDTIAPTIEDKSRNAEKAIEEEDFKQLLKCLPIPAILQAILEDVYLHGLSNIEAGAKYNLSPSSVCHYMRRGQPKIATYLQETGRYTHKLKELVIHVDSTTP